jgi:hypothetical protein
MNRTKLRRNDMDGMAELLGMSMGAKSDHIPVKDVLEEAQDFVKRYHETETFKPGDLVAWKPGMKNKKYPAYDEPIVVLEVFEPLRNKDTGTTYGAEPLDMRCILHKDSDGDLNAFAHDSHRFTKYNG